MPDDEGIDCAARRCLTKQRERFSADGAEPVGCWRPNDPAESAGSCRRASRPRELAAWTAVGRVVLNLDETITKE